MMYDKFLKGETTAEAWSEKPMTPEQIRRFTLCETCLEQMSKGTVTHVTWLATEDGVVVYIDGKPMPPHAHGGPPDALTGDRP
jgi:hypothetical protein